MTISNQGKIDTVGTESVLALQKANRSSFCQALQLIRCFDADPGNSRVAATLSLLFDRLQLKDSSERLYSWLYHYISVFATEPPRSQTDQSEKVLAVAAYLFISDRNGFDLGAPESYLSTYIEYASSQSWFGDSFLAFYCNSLSDWTACQTVNAYFEDRFERFLARRHVPAICQAVLTLHTRLSAIDLDRSLEVLFNALSSQSISLNHASWGLMAFSKLAETASRTNMANKLAELIDKQLTDHVSDLVRESRLYTALAKIWGDVAQADIHHLESSSTYKGGSSVDVTLNVSGPTSPSQDVPGQNKNTENRLSLADVGLALVALHFSGRHELLGVVATDEARLISSLQKAQELEEEGKVVLRRAENTVSSILAILVTFALGLALILYFLGGNISVALDVSEISWRNIDVFLWAVVWIDSLLAQIQTLWSGGSAIRGLLQIPLLRHFLKADKRIWK